MYVLKIRKQLLVFKSLVKHYGCRMQHRWCSWWKTIPLSNSDRTGSYGTSQHSNRTSLLLMISTGKPKCLTRDMLNNSTASTWCTHKVLQRTNTQSITQIQPEDKISENQQERPWDRCIEKKVTYSPSVLEQHIRLTIKHEVLHPASNFPSTFKGKKSMDSTNKSVLMQETKNCWERNGKRNKIHHSSQL